MKTYEQRLDEHICHGEQTLQESLVTLSAWWEIKGIRLTTREEDLFKVVFHEAWNKSRQDWVLHNGEPT